MPLSPAAAVAPLARVSLWSSVQDTPCVRRRDGVPWTLTAGERARALVSAAPERRTAPSSVHNTPQARRGGGMSWTLNRVGAATARRGGAA